MSSVGTRRATVNALAGWLAGCLGLALIGGLLLIWVAALWSLLTGPTGFWGLAVLYVVVVVTIPASMLLAVQALSSLQRERLGLFLGVEVSPPVVPRQWWPLGPWRSAATWRQLGFHLAAVAVDGLGGGLALICWVAPALALGYVATQRPSPVAVAISLVAGAVALAAAPWLSRRVARADVALARLLGMSRSDELAIQVESLERSRADIVAATDAERRRIERDLHDGAQQRLVSLAMNLGMARASLGDAPDDTRQTLADAHDEAVLALAEMRAFIRGLHPAVLNDRGLDAALSGLAAHASIPVALKVDVPQRTSASVEAVAYFIVSEALTNIAKHAQATRAEVTVTRTGDLLRVVVADDGKGGAAPTGDGTGLRGLGQRAAAVDGTLTIDSPPGGPTMIIAELPCES